MILMQIIFAGFKKFILFINNAAVAALANHVPNVVFDGVNLCWGDNNTTGRHEQWICYWEVIRTSYL